MEGREEVGGAGRVSGKGEASWAQSVLSRDLAGLAWEEGRGSRSPGGTTVPQFPLLPGL